LDTSSLATDLHLHFVHGQKIALHERREHDLRDYLPYNPGQVASQTVRYLTIWVAPFFGGIDPAITGILVPSVILQQMYMF